MGVCQYTFFGFLEPVFLGWAWSSTCSGCCCVSEISSASAPLLGWNVQYTLHYSNSKKLPTQANFGLYMQSSIHVPKFFTPPYNPPPRPMLDISSGDSGCLRQTFLKFARHVWRNQQILAWSVACNNIKILTSCWSSIWTSSCCTGGGWCVASISWSLDVKLPGWLVDTVARKVWRGT